MEIIGSGCAPLGQRKAIGVIEGGRISQQLYLGEFDYISDAIDLQYIEEPDAAVTAVSYEDALQRYAATLTELDSFQNLHQLAGEFQTPEIVVEESLKPDQIIEWRLQEMVPDTSQAATKSDRTQARVAVDEFTTRTPNNASRSSSSPNLILPQ